MKVLLMALVTLSLFESSAQVRPLQQRKTERNSVTDRAAVSVPQQLEGVRGVFTQVERGIRSGSFSSSTVPFASHVLVNITGGETGYYSSNQAFSVLESYFSARRPVSFEFSRLNERGPNPYATGRLTFVSRGTKESAQIYIALTVQDSRWVISQFNIY